MLDRVINKSGTKVMGFVAPVVVTAAGVTGAMMSAGMVKSVARGVAMGGALKVAEKAMNKDNLLSGVDDQPLMLPGIGSYGQAVVPTDDLRIRAAYSLRAHILPEHIRRAIATGAIKIVNNAFYKVFDFSGLKQNDLMLNADTLLSGVTNVNSRKLEENNFFLLTVIILQTGKFTDKPHDAEFGIPCREILNGEFSLKNGDKVY